jgi:hypothetical protein
VNMTRQRIMTPPPPIPCRHRPTSIVSRPRAMQQRMEPAVKRASDIITQTGRPKMSLREAMKGIVTAEVSKYDVPIQKA